MLHHFKDAAFSFAARSALNLKLHGIGELTDLKVDTKTNSLWLEMKLVGEPHPVDIHVRKYRVHSEPEPQVVIEEVVASRDWVTGALGKFIVDRPFAIPGLLEKLAR